MSTRVIPAMMLMVSVLVLLPKAATAEEAALAINAGDTAWMLVSTALVMLMTPGLAIFYAGMARRKNVLGDVYLFWISQLPKTGESFYR